MGKALATLVESSHDVLPALVEVFYHEVSHVNIEAINLEEPVAAREHKAQLGQFMTSPQIASFMASLLDVHEQDDAIILDAGAGTGSLSCALIREWQGKGFKGQANLIAYEVDARLLATLHDNLSGERFASVKIHSGDFIAENFLDKGKEIYSHAILNPPYKKISSRSKHRLMLRSAGIETGNLYSAFVAMALRDLKPGGQLVAIIPRSFCNGPYFKPFREYILNRAAMTHIHLFESRSHAFREDGVLQENIIIRLVKDGLQGEVRVSTSSKSDFADLESRLVGFGEVVHNSDPDLFIHIPTLQSTMLSSGFRDSRISLTDLGLGVSTGPVVGFRIKEHLRDQMDAESVPLLYPIHLRDGRVRWPLMDNKKPNAIVHNSETQKWLFPNGCYCVVRRFSSKEERHRIVASVVSSEDFRDVEYLGLDNKLNVFHRNKSGMSLEFVHGLCAYLNTDLVDEEFRLFSGHTQVNATDLRRMKYPAEDLLCELGARIMNGESLVQEEIYLTLKIKNERS